VLEENPVTRRLLVPLALALVAGLALFGTSGLSGATFTSTSRNAASTVTAAADWTPPTIAVRDPGSPLKDTVTLLADATDAESGVASVKLQYLAPGGSGWVTLCTTSTASYSCAWNTRDGADGSYLLRAIAADNAGYTTTSATVSTVVANSLLVALTSPDVVVQGTVPLTATVFNAGSVKYSVTIQYALADSGSWKTLCTVPAAPYTCSWNTAAAAFTQGESYDLRAAATAGSTTTYSAVVEDIQVDNIAPTVTMVDPGTPLRGTVALPANASDSESRIADVAVQAQRSGTSTWTTLCAPTSSPYTCRYDTTQLSDGPWSFRAVATDLAGNVSTSALVTRTVDNTVSSVSLEDPGAVLSGVVTLAATASSSAGITSVRIERAGTGTSSWTPVCTDTTAPYSCSFDTTSVAEGLYDFRAVLLDGSGRTTTSTSITGRRVDNSPLRGHDVQTFNGGLLTGRLDLGDQIWFTYTDRVNLASLANGWTGSALAVTVRVRDGSFLGLGAKGDTLDVMRGGTAVNLGSVNLNQDYVKNKMTITFNATMVASTTTVNDKTATVITLTLGQLSSGNGLRTVTAGSTMVWTPSALATDLYDRAASTAAAAELGALDREF
jgi:hypothetical protein